jgi:hypothetical protein
VALEGTLSDHRRGLVARLLRQVNTQDTEIADLTREIETRVAPRGGNDRSQDADSGLTPEERSELRRRAASATSARRDSLRVRIILLRTPGKREADLSKTLGTNVNTVSLWSKRLETGGLEALSDKKGAGPQVLASPGESAAGDLWCG